MQSGKADFETLEKKAIEWGEPSVASGKQVMINYVPLSYPIFERKSYRGSQ